VMISGHGTVQTAVEATQRGAFDFLEKPLDTDRLLVTVRNALRHVELTGENERLREVVTTRYRMVGDAAALKEVRELVAKVGPTNARVLITGENGSGKELVARALHDHSPRRQRPFVELNCAAIPSELIESELFGHMKGSFTGAVADRAGKFEQADGGTLFLDEVGDMSLAAQAKLLRVLQEGVVTRIGGSKSITVDVRVLAATNKDLRSEIEHGRVREDLLYRLNVVEIRVPPLRERLEDIPVLVPYFAEQIATSAGVPLRRFGDDALARLARRPWPGNVRELRNAIERAITFCPSDQISVLDLPDAVRSTFRRAALPADSHQMQVVTLHAAERGALLCALRTTNGNQSRAARLLGIERHRLARMLKRHKLSAADRAEPCGAQVESA